MTNSYIDDSIFETMFERSHKSVWMIAIWMWKNGVAVEVPARKIYHGREDYDSDDGDLFIVHPKYHPGGTRHRIEVKHLTINFTGRDDWKYGSKFIVESKEQYDRKDPEPYCYYIVSHDLKNFARVFCSRSSNWTVEGRTNKHNVTKDYYFAPIDSVDWFRLLPEVG